MATREQIKEQKKRRIIEAAAVVFAQNGYNRTNVADIAKQAQIGKGTLYEYFDSKEDLFFAVFEWFFELMTAHTAVGIDQISGTAADRLRALSESLMGAWEQVLEVQTLFMEFWAAAGSSPKQEKFKEAFKTGYRTFRQIIGDLIREGIQAGIFRSDIDIDSLTSVMVGAWDCLPLQAWFDPEVNPAVVAREFMDVILKGLAADATAPQNKEMPS
jgi:AcrR family transcriptional regulator